MRGAPYLIDSNTAGALAKGDPVKLEATGNIELGAADDGVTRVGVFSGCKYKDANGEWQYSDYIPAAKTSFTEMEADVWDDPNIIFGIQADSGSTPAATDVGNTANDVIGTSDSTRKISAAELDSSDIGTGAQLKILGLVRTPNNTWGEHVDLEVIFNEHIYKAAVAGV
jgi:hypothetical protein